MTELVEHLAPVERNVEAFRNAPWGGDTGLFDIVITGVDWSAATFKMEVRSSKGEAGAALITLTNAAAGSQGISASYTTTYAHPATGAIVSATIIRPQINKAAMQALPAASPSSDDKVFYYDIHVTPVGALELVLFHGTFTVDPGSTV